MSAEIVVKNIEKITFYNKEGSFGVFDRALITLNDGKSVSCSQNDSDESKMKFFLALSEFCNENGINLSDPATYQKKIFFEKAIEIHDDDDRDYFPPSGEKNKKNNSKARIAIPIAGAIVITGLFLAAGPIRDGIKRFVSTHSNKPKAPVMDDLTAGQNALPTAVPASNYDASNVAIIADNEVCTVYDQNEERITSSGIVDTLVRHIRLKRVSPSHANLNIEYGVNAAFSQNTDAIGKFLRGIDSLKGQLFIVELDDSFDIYSADNLLYDRVQKFNNIVESAYLTGNTSDVLKALDIFFQTYHSATYEDLDIGSRYYLNAMCREAANMPADDYSVVLTVNNVGTASYTIDRIRMDAYDDYQLNILEQLKQLTNSK